MTDSTQATSDFNIAIPQDWQGAIAGKTIAGLAPQNPQTPSTDERSRHLSHLPRLATDSRANLKCRALIELSVNVLIGFLKTNCFNLKLN